jgi:hypothetical protein
LQTTGKEIYKLSTLWIAYYGLNTKRDEAAEEIVKMYGGTFVGAGGFIGAKPVIRDIGFEFEQNLSSEQKTEIEDKLRALGEWDNISWDDDEIV